MSTPTTTLTPEQLYQLIKEYEAEIPIPAPFVTVVVVGYDAATGTNVDLRTQVYTDPEPLEHEPGQQPVNPAPRFEGEEYLMFSISAQWRETVTRVPAPIVPLAPVLLQFSVGNAPIPWSVTVNGYTTNVPAGQASVSVNVWDMTAIDWTLQYGNNIRKDQLMIQRPGSIPAAGGFTIPVIPVAVIYAPLQDSEKKSFATYAQGDTVGTSVIYDFSTDTSQAVEPAFADGSAFRAALGLTATALGFAAGAGDSSDAKSEAAASKDITGILSLLPSDEILKTQGLTTDNSSTVTVTYLSTSAISTNALVGGPGVGDVIVFFKDVLVAWAYYNGSLQLCPIGWTTALVGAALIQSNPGQVGISASDQQLLLSLDPFVAGGPSAQLTAPRFTQPTGIPASIEYGAEIFTDSYAATIDYKTVNSQKSYTTDTNTFSPGEILQMFGVGTSKSQVTTTLTTTTGSDTSQTTTLSVNLTAGPADIFVVAIWYDSLFGTWAFQQLQPTSQPVASGSGAAPGTVVKLQSAAGQVHVAVADAQGHYQFRAPNIAPGQAQLFVGNNPPATVEIAVGPFRGPIHPLPVAPGLNEAKGN
jgi:hypothetical protein